MAVHSVTAGKLRALRRVTIPLSRIPVLRRVAARVARHYAGSDAEVRIDDFDNDQTFYCRLDSHIASRIFWYGMYSRPSLRLLSRLVGSEDVVMDIGANEGEHTVFCAKRLTKGRVFSFEPNIAMRERLTRNIAANGFDNVTVVPMALSDRRGEMVLYSAHERFSDGSYNDGLATLFAREGVADLLGSVAVTTLDEFVQEQGLDRVDILKIDVEGAEYSVLSGGLSVLRRFQPLIILEVEDETARSAGHSADELLSLVRLHGYAIFNILESGALVPQRGVATRDVLCVPAGSTIM
jgi:FkbM family methyltransferase